MASSEGAADVSTEERFERKKAELIELIEKLAKRLSLGEGHAVVTTAIDGRDLRAGSKSRHGDPYIGLLEDELAELIRQYEMLAAQLDFDDGHGAATTTINGRNVRADSTSEHGDPYIARSEAEKAELRRECELGAGQFGPHDGHSAAMTTTNGRGLEAGSTTKAPEIIVTAPDDLHGAAANTNNGRHVDPSNTLCRRGSGATSTCTMVPDDGHGVSTTTINGLHLGPISVLRRRGPGADNTCEMIPNDRHGAVANTINGRNREARSAFINYVAQLLQDVDVNVEPDNDDKFTLAKRMLAVCTGIAVTAFVGIYFQS